MRHFEAFYLSDVQHPYLLWAAVLIGLVFALSDRKVRKHGSIVLFLLFFGLASIIDAWLTSAQPLGLGALDSELAAVLSIVFVVVGDFRYLLVVLGLNQGWSWRTGGIAFCASLGVPLVSSLVHRNLPEPLASESRYLFLIYELIFVAFAVFLATRFSKTRRISAFVAFYYALWASADFLILGNQDLGFLLRVAPNALYYGALVPVMAREWARLEDEAIQSEGAPSGSRSAPLPAEGFRRS